MIGGYEAQADYYPQWHQPYNYVTQLPYGQLTFYLFYFFTSYVYMFFRVFNSGSKPI